LTGLPGLPHSSSSFFTWSPLHSRSSAQPQLLPSPTHLSPGQGSPLG
jgi:hypothetical protein